MTLFNYVLLTATGFGYLGIIDITLKDRFSTVRGEIYNRVSRPLQPRNFRIFTLSLYRS